MADTPVPVKDRGIEAPPAGDTSTKIQPDGPPKTSQQIATEWDAAYNSKDYKAVTADLGTAALQAYQNGGTAALGELQKNLNKLIVAPGAGPLFVVNGDKIEIHNAQGFSPEEAAKLPESERAKLTSLTTVAGDMAASRELTPIATLDKPNMQGIKLKPGEKVSEEFPSEYAVATALKAGGLLHTDWMAGNPEQKYLVDNLHTAGGELSSVPKGVLDGVAQTGGVDKVNKFLADNGMDMRLDPVSTKTDVAMAAVLKLKGGWSGHDSKMTIDGNEYPSAVVDHVQTFKQKGTDVVELYQKDGVTVYAAPIGDDKLTSFQVTQRAQALTPTADSQLGPATKVEMPKVDKNVQTDLVGLKGMRATDGSQITQAKMQTKLAIDEKGFSAEQGVALAASRGIEISQTMRLDKPFIVWATADGLSQPLFATTVDKRYWKDPKRTSDK